MEWLTSIMQLSLLVGACDPYGLHKERKKKHTIEIIKQADKAKVDPYELLAIAITESAMNPKAYSHTKDTGLFQVNCKWWYKKFKYKNIKACEKALFEPKLNISKGIHILTHFRNNYSQCRGTLAYRCYNGGQGWPRSKNREKIVRYSNRVKERKVILRKYYEDFIENIRQKLKNRS
jgi:soluble lytic murein transglycosylase-like protein|tara:strand:+ start:4724 stop:5254 length:531 start_codon:yes stop_codon:yes gene_type:complete